MYALVNTNDVHEHAYDLYLQVISLLLKTMNNVFAESGCDFDNNWVRDVIAVVVSKSTALCQALYAKVQLLLCGKVGIIKYMNFK